MKKYVVKYKEGGKVFGEYFSPYEASDKLMAYLLGDNSYLDEDCLSLFDFVLEEVECDVNEVITDFESARKALGIKPNDEFTVVRTRHSDTEFNDVASLVDDINPKHIEALMAINKLLTIAEAWNKADGFVPDFNNYQQKKWVPTFEYNDYDTGLIFWASTFYSSSAPYDVGFRICFKTSERASQFGKQFENLYNKVFLINK